MRLIHSHMKGQLVRRFYRAVLVLGLTYGLVGVAYAQTDNVARADFDGNGEVDFPDFLAFAGVFGKTSSDPDFDVRMDLNGNGEIDFPDFLVFAGVFGQSYTPPGTEAPMGAPEVLMGSITSDRLLTADKYYLLSGAVFVQAGATLTIEPGTTIFGEGATNGTLIIAQGGKIHANGRADKPIVFTSDAEEGQRDRGQWGGLIINGRAPINTGATAEGEGNTGTYGGNDPNDNSGVLRYVRVEFAGIEFSPDNELNGIAFQGVGSGTVVEYIQVHYNQDDGIEFFGGTVNAKYLYCSGIRDDSFDWTDGWKGKGQFWVAQQHGDAANHGFEADNKKDNTELTPRSNPTIYNVTLVGDPNGPESDTGLLLREGTAATLRNFIVIGFNKGGLDVDGSSTHNQAESGALSLQNTIFFNNKVEGVAGNFVTDSDGFDERVWATNPQFNNAEIDPMLMAPYSTSSPDFTPGANSPAVNGTVPVASPPDYGFFDSVNFIGGVDPANNWLKGWTTNEKPAGQ